jgi:translation elongation factor EF-1alpha
MEKVRSHIILILFGNKDAGKSTIGGHFLSMIGTLTSEERKMRIMHRSMYASRNILQSFIR